MFSVGWFINWFKDQVFWLLRNWCTHNKLNNLIMLINMQLTVLYQAPPRPWVQILNIFCDTKHNMLYITQLIKTHDMLVSITKTVSIYECLQIFIQPHMFEHKHLTSMVTARFITFDILKYQQNKWNDIFLGRETREMILFLNALRPHAFTKFVELFFWYFYFSYS